MNTNCLTSSTSRALTLIDFTSAYNFSSFVRGQVFGKRLTIRYHTIQYDTVRLHDATKYYTFVIQAALISGARTNERTSNSMPFKREKKGFAGYRIHQSIHT